MLRRSFFLVLLTVLGNLGCGTGGTSTEVKGKVLLDGKPVSGAQVQLLFKAEGVGGMHTGATDDAGEFRIIESGTSNNPIQPGTYVVLVSKLTWPKDAANLPGGGMGAVKEELPTIYQDRSASPLIVEVQSATTILPPLELKSAS